MRAKIINESTDYDSLKRGIDFTIKNSYNVEIGEIWYGHNPKMVNGKDIIKDHFVKIIDIDEENEIIHVQKLNDLRPGRYDNDLSFLGIDFIDAYQLTNL